MEKVTFTYEAPRDVEFGSTDYKVSMTFDTEGMTLSDFSEYVRKFCMAIGYLPESVKRVFPDDVD